MDTGDILNRGKDLIEDEIASPKKDADIDYKSKFATYYSRILFFAFLTDARVISLEEVIARIKNYPEDLSIAKNLKIDTYLLGIFQEHINPFVLSEIDYKIQNINSLANDTTIPNIQRAQNAMKKFGRLSESEIVTPEHIADDMIDIIPDTDIDTTTKWLDIASKQGEFVYAIYKKYGEEVANNVYSIPSSKIAYEFTKKLYSLLGLNKDHIEQNYTAYDLIKENTLIEEDTLKINHIPMKFDIVIGNPPYQEGDG